jgi:cytochrome P450
VSEIVVRWGAGELPTGTGTAPALSQLQWEGLYTRLENGAGSSGAVRPLVAVLAATTPLRPDGPLPIAVARFDYSVPGDPAEHETFFAAALLHDQWGLAQPTYRGRTVPFLVSDAFFLGAAPPDSVELDPGDGGGFRAVTPDTPLTATYADFAAVTATLRCTYGPDTRTAAFTVTLSDQPAAPVPDQTIALSGACGNTGSAWVYLAKGASKLTHPLIMVEGFPGGHPPDYLYDTLDQQGTATALRAAGYDVVIVGLNQGMDKVQRNADVLVDCIRKVRTSTNQPLVVGGTSMGGLISRYALLAMEARMEPHGAAVFLTIDTPHRGTYTSLAAQWFVQSFLAHLPALGAYAALLDSPANQQFDLWWLHDGAVQTSRLRDELMSDFAELGDWPKLPRKLAVSAGRGDGLRTAAAGAQVMSWSGEPWVTAELHALADHAPQTIGEGTWFDAVPPALPALTFDGGIAWEGAPGGQEPYNGQVAAIAQGVGCGTVTHELDSICTVPTISALGLDQDPFAPVPPPGSGASPFDDYACSADNEPHLTITPEVSAWLLTTLGSPPTSEAGPTVDFNPHDPAFLADPYPTYAHYREEQPVLWVPLYGSDWMFRYADCQTILQSTDVWLKNPPQGWPQNPGPYGVMASFPQGLFASDPPLHTQLRSILEPMFDEAIKTAPALAAEFAAPLLAAARQQGRMELIQDYALPLPSSVLFTLLGIPNEAGILWPALIQWQAAIAAAHDITQSLSVRAGGATCSMALNTYFEGLLLANRAKPAQGLFAQICDAFANAGLSNQEVQMCAVDFLVAGYLSTTFIIGTGVRNLLLNPEQLAALRADPTLMPGALEEMLRMDGPVQVIDRYAAVDTEIDGRPYPQNAKVTAVVGAADHDPSVFADPEAFLIQRTNESHMAFGAGIHYCIGAPLVRLVGPVALQALLTEFPNLALAGDPQWQTDPYLRAVTNLPLSF